MHVMLACVGSAGDVHPFIAIGLALQQRGHEVELMASGYFEPRIVAAGLGFIAIGSAAEFDTVLRDPEIWDPLRGIRALARHLGPMLEPAYDALVAHLRPGTVLVGSTLAFPVRLAQEKLGIPAATVHLAPSVIFSADAPAAWPGATWITSAPRFVAAPLQRFAEWAALDPTMGGALAPLRAKLGLPPVDHVMSHWCHSPQRVVCAFPEWFAPPQRDWPANTVCTGFPRWSGAEQQGLAPELGAFLQAGAAPIAFTPGSAMAHGQGFFATALAACERLGRRAVLVTPFRESLPATLPPWAHHASYAPYDLLAPRAAAFVHHGGIGTCAQALAAGTPQMITPFAHDQFDNAMRLVQLGVATRVAPGASVVRWTAALRPLLDDPVRAARCREVARQMASERPAAVQIAEWIESLATR